MTTKGKQPAGRIPSGSSEPRVHPIEKITREGPKTDGEPTALQAASSREVGTSKAEVLQRIMKELRGPGSFNLNHHAELLLPFKSTLTAEEKSELGTLLMPYFVDHFRRAQFKDLEGLEKLMYLFESIKIVLDQEFLSKLRLFNKRLGPYTIQEILREKDSGSALSRLRELLPETNVDERTLSDLRQYLPILFVFKGTNGNLQDIGDTNPGFAAAIVILCERFAGEELPLLRTSLSRAVRKILTDEKTRFDTQIPLLTPGQM